MDKGQGSAPEVNRWAWLADGGENAVIILPNEKLANSVTGGDAPRLYRMVKKWLRKDLVPESRAYDCRLMFSENPAFNSRSELSPPPIPRPIAIATHWAATNSAALLAFCRTTNYHFPSLGTFFYNSIQPRCDSGLISATQESAMHF